MSYYLLKSFYKRYDIYTNYNLDIPTKKISFDFIKNCVENKTQFNKAVFGIDEIHQLIDSRRTQSKKNQIISYFCLQSAKRNVHILGTAQYFGQIEKRLRQNTKIRVMCSPVVKRINKNNKTEFINYEFSSREIPEQIQNIFYIKNTIFIKTIDDIGNENYKHKVKYIKAKEIFNKYNTKELIGFD